MTTLGLRCSFCYRSCGSADLIVGDLGARICLDCLRNHHRSSTIHDAVMQPATRAELNVGDMLRTLPLISAEAVQLDVFMRHRVSNLRDRNVSYRQIGEALGVTKQAAWERFSQSSAGSSRLMGSLPSKTSQRQ